MANIPIFTQKGDQGLYNDELNQALNGAIGQNGFSISQLTTSQINSIFNDSQSGTIWFNTTTNEWWGNRNGTLVSFNTTDV